MQYAMRQLSFWFVLLFTTFAWAQRFDIVSGKLENLKGITQYNVGFDFAEVALIGLDNREANDGRDYRAAFTAYFNKMFGKAEVVIGQFPDAKYTMLVKPTWIYKGYHAASEFGAAKISATITVYETADPSRILLAIHFEKAVGTKHDIMSNNVSDRVSWAYEKLAKNMSMQIKRVM